MKQAPGDNQGDANHFKRFFDERRVNNLIEPKEIDFPGFVFVVAIAAFQIIQNYCAN